MSKEKSYFSWGRVILISLIVGCTELMWTLYNTYVPIWLQAGNPSFNLGDNTVIVGFGFGAFVTGIILTFDNIVGLFISPLIGMVSDSTRTRWGRRKPWIIFATPIAILAFALIPLVIMQIPPELNGKTDQLTGILVLFIIVLTGMLVPLAIIRTPANVFVYDITPSKHRTTASAIANLIGAGSGIIAAIVGAMLFDINMGLPFWIGSVLTAIVITLVAVRITEPIDHVELPKHAKTESFRNTLKKLGSLPQEDVRSLVFLYLSVFFSYVAFGQLGTFASSYGVSVIGLDVGASGMIVAAGGSAFLLATLPAGFITKRITRKTANIIGFSGFGLMGVFLYFFGSPITIWPAIAIGAFLWAFCWVNQDPMVMDSIDSDDLLGSLGGMMSVARTLGYIIGPIVGGFAIEKLGNNYNNMWLVVAVACILGILAILPVTKGEVKPEQAKAE